MIWQLRIFENAIQADVSESLRPEISEERAKITGLVCIGCAAAAAAVLFAFLGSMLFSDLSAVAMILYFVFLLVSAAFGVLRPGQPTRLRVQRLRLQIRKPAR